MDNLFIEVVGGGILAVMIIKEVFAFILKQRNGNGNGNGKTKTDMHDMYMLIKDISGDVDQLKLESRDLWLWHNKEDPDEPGVKVWYANRKRTEDALVKISESIEKQTEILDYMRGDIKDLKRDISK